MSNTPKISIIVPVYNVKKYLNRCIDSILAQTFTDWELLLVDDGSTDRSGEICDEYAKKDSRIRVFHKENGGVSSTRNLGLDNVRGEYVTFVDSDDLIHPETLDICSNVIRRDNLDIIQYSFSRSDSQLGKLGKESTGVCLLTDYVSTQKFLTTVWGSVIRTSVIEKHHIRFNPKMRLAEDQLFIYTCLEQSKKMMLLPNILYYYNDNPGSATNNERIEDIVFSAQMCTDFKKMHPLFSNRMDDLVLFFIEKLILRKQYSEAYFLFVKLNPTFYSLRPWPISLMIKISHHNVRLGFHIGCRLYSCYAQIINVGSQIKHKLLKQVGDYAKS